MKRPRLAILDNYEGMLASASATDELRKVVDVTVFDRRLGFQELVEALEKHQMVLAIRERTRFPFDLLERRSRVPRRLGHRDPARCPGIPGPPPEGPPRAVTNLVPPVPSPVSLPGHAPRRPLALRSRAHAQELLQETVFGGARRPSTTYLRE